MHLLYVEDNPADVALFRTALKQSTTSLQLSVVSDGQAALDFLHHHEPYTAVPAPDILLLDLNLPYKDGYTVLHELKHHLQLKRIPVVIFTSTSEAHAVRRCYELGANAFVVKAFELERYIAVVHALVQFWSRCLFG